MYAVHSPPHPAIYPFYILLLLWLTTMLLLIGFSFCFCFGSTNDTFKYLQLLYFKIVFLVYFNHMPFLNSLTLLAHSTQLTTANRPLSASGNYATLFTHHPKTNLSFYALFYLLNLFCFLFFFCFIICLSLTYLPSLH